MDAATLHFLQSKGKNLAVHGVAFLEESELRISSLRVCSFRGCVREIDFNIGIKGIIKVSRHNLKSASKVEHVRNES